jgi:hypothetical protein
VTRFGFYVRSRGAGINDCDYGNLPGSSSLERARLFRLHEKTRRGSVKTLTGGKIWLLTCTGNRVRRLSVFRRPTMVQTTNVRRIRYDDQ